MTTKFQLPWNESIWKYTVEGKKVSEKGSDEESLWEFGVTTGRANTWVAGVHEGRENANEVEQTSWDPSPNLEKETEIQMHGCQWSHRIQSNQIHLGVYYDWALRLNKETILKRIEMWKKNSSRYEGVAKRANTTKQSVHSNIFYQQRLTGCLNLTTVSEKNLPLEGLLSSWRSLTMPPQ